MDFPKQPKIIPIRHGISGYELYLDSSLGYVCQGLFDTRKEVEDYLDELRDGNPEHTPSLWSQR